MEKMRFVQVKEQGNSSMCLINLHEIMKYIPEFGIVKDFHGHKYGLVKRDDVDLPVQFVPQIADCIVEI